MEKNLNSPIKEETYEQFDTDEINPQNKNHKKINNFSSKQIIKYILLSFVILCLILLLFNLTQNRNISNIFESKSISKKLSLPLNKNELNFNNEPQFLENSITLDYSIKGSYISKQSNDHITLITILLIVEKKCSKDNCLECYINQEIKYPELGEKEAFDKVYKEMGLRNTIVENVYCQQHNPTKPKGDYTNQIHFVWNKYKRKMILIKGVNDIDDVIDKTYNNEYLQAVIQRYEFTFMDHIYEKNKKYYLYNDKELIFNEIKFE